MQALLEVLNKTTTWFESKGIEHPRLQAELIFSHILQCKRLDLYLSYDRPLEEDLLKRARELVKRRAQKEPLQHVIGEWPFDNIILKVDPRALIPRQETEELVDYIRQTSATEPHSLLDLGTGTGAIALALANSWKNCKVTAVDFSQEALALAEENAIKNDLDVQLTFIQSNWFENVEGTFPIIVSNPPYLSQEEWECADKEVKDFDPYSALVAKDKGLSDLKIIFKEAIHHLEDGGFIAMETGIKQHEVLSELAKEYSYTKTKSIKDLQERERFFFAWK